MSQLLFIPVPGGIQADGTATLRLVVVPRLDTGSMADNGLASWPPAELRAPLAVTFTPDSGAPTTVEVTPRLVDQDGLWAQVFGAATVSAPLRQELADPVTVTPTGEHVNAIGTSYQTVVQAYATAAATDPATAAAAYSAAVGTQLRSPAWSPPPIALEPNARLDAPAPVPVTDATRIYGLLREHPRVLAALGLILELDVPLTAIPAGTTGVVRIGWPTAAAVVPALPPLVARGTAYLRDVFLPASHVDDQHPVSDLDQGIVCIDDETRWQLASVDVESGVQRMQAAATSGPNPSIDRGDAVTPTVTNALPALRTAGMMLLRTGREQDFSYRRARSLAVAADYDPTLYAEDLVLGYRIDVREVGDTQWHSLCLREATYRINGTVVADAGVIEEGHVKAHSARRDDRGQLQADEVVTRWDGWSLAVPRVFPAPLVSAGGDNADLPYQLDTEFTVPPESLPPLRFGSSYEVRARVADLAGGGVDAADSSGDRHAATYQFQRYEPVSSPALLLPDGADPDDLGVGVHVAQLVVTSEGGDPSATAVDPATPAQTQRLLARPTVSLTTAEWHGALDGDADGTWPIVQLAIAGQLPDPVAYGVAAAVVSEPGGPVVDPVGQAWPAFPDTTTAVVDLQASAADSDTPVLAWGAAGLTVSLAPAQDIAVQLSSTVAAADVGGLAVSGWAAESLAAGGDAGLIATVAGQHPMITPATTVRCVHAVRRPLANPSGDLAVSRDAETIPVVIAPSRPLCGIDPASTGQVDVTASWVEVTDDLRSTPVGTPARTTLADVPVQSLVVNPGDTDFTERIEHHLPDTRHRDVTYTITAVSRFRSYFPQRADGTFTAVPLSYAADVLSTNRPAAPKVASVVPAFVWEQTLGPTITRIRHGNRIRVELERPWFDSGDDERLALITAALDVESDSSNATQAGRDPMYFTPTCDRWPLASAVTGSGDEPARVTSAEGPTVDVVPAEVFFDARAGRWFADFDLDGVPGRSYMPMVRPALARYQRHSVPGYELSPVVLSDFVPLLPDRTLTVTVDVAPDRSQLTVTATLSGLGPDGPEPNQVDAVIEIGGPAAELTATALNHATVGWFAYPASVQRALLGQPIVFTIPFGADASLASFRLRVRELEQAVFDPDPVDPSAEPEVMGTIDELSWRVIFVDTVPLQWSTGTDELVQLVS